MSDLCLRVCVEEFSCRGCRALGLCVVVCVRINGIRTILVVLVVLLMRIPLTNRLSKSYGEVERHSIKPPILGRIFRDSLNLIVRIGP